MKCHLQRISYLIAFLSIIIACHKEEATTSTTNPTPPPPPPPPPPADYIDGCFAGSRPTITAQMVPVGKLSQARTGMAAVAVGSKVLFAGAWETNDAHHSSRVDIYDVTTDSWSTAELSKSRSHIAAIAVKNKMFFAGGLEDGATDVVDVYDAATNTWSIKKLSEPRFSMAAATVGDKVFFAGGVTRDGLSSSIVDVYDLSTGTWSVAQLKEQGANLAAVTIKNKIYFAGGYKFYPNWEEEATIGINIYDLALNSWTADRLKKPMGVITGVAVDDKIYWASGCDVEIDDIQTGVNEEALLYHGGAWYSSLGQHAVVKDNKIIFFSHYQKNANQFDIYDVATKQWMVGEVPIKVLGTSIVAVGNTVYLAGGSIGGVLTDQVWKLEF